MLWLHTPLRIGLSTAYRYAVGAAAVATVTVIGVSDTNVRLHGWQADAAMAFIAAPGSMVTVGVDAD